MQTQSVTIVAVIEKVGGFIKGNPAPGSAMFTFGSSFGSLKMALTAVGAKFDVIPPQQWQKDVGFPVRKGEAPRERKIRLRSLAQRTFPDFPMWREPKSIGRQDSVCDAMLLAHYSKMRNR